MQTLQSAISGYQCAFQVLNIRRGLIEDDRRRQNSARWQPLRTSQCRGATEPTENTSGPRRQSRLLAWTEANGPLQMDITKQIRADRALGSINSCLPLRALWGRNLWAISTALPICQFHPNSSNKVYLSELGVFVLKLYYSLTRTRVARHYNCKCKSVFSALMPTRLRTKQHSPLSEWSRS